MISRYLDFAGTTVSWLCLLHCIALPAAIASLPFYGLHFLATEEAEMTLIGISVVLAILSFAPSYLKHHRRLSPILLFAGGLTLIILSHHVFGGNFIVRVLMLSTGALGITAAHLLNHSFCKECSDCESIHCSV